MSQFPIDQDILNKALQLAESASQLSEDERQSILDVLEAYECWAPSFKLLESAIKNHSKATLSDYVRLAKIQYQYLEDIFAAAETCTQAVAKCRLSYRQFIEEVLPVVMEQEDWSSEATIFQSICERFAVKSDQVLALERLCLLYEKKIFNESELSATYSRLLGLDANNVKALRYFKLVFTQNYEWEKVVSIIRSLIKVNRHPRDVFRLAQELSAVLLYQLDQPREAITTIETHCEGSPLDTSTILYDANQRLGDWRGCMKVLRECLVSVNTDEQRAILHFRLAGLEERVGRLAEALSELERCIKIKPDLLEAFENMVHLSIKQKDWPRLEQTLERITTALKDEVLRGQINDVLLRLREGINKHASRPNPET